jgi:hypothetical protein
MATISRTGITGGGTIQTSHVTNIIDALDGTSTTTTVVASGSFSGSLVGTLTGTASFATTALSASYAANVPVTASYALSALSSSYAVTASFATNILNTQVTNTTTGTGPYSITFVDVSALNPALAFSTQVTQRVDASGLTYNASTNTITTTASYAVTASRAVTASFADLSSQVLVQRTATDADHFMVIVDSGNSTPTAESLNTVTNIRVNPGTDTISAVTVTGSFNVTGSISAVKFATVDFSVIASASGTGQFAIPVTQTSGTPKPGSMYWNDATEVLYIYSATNSRWNQIQLNP